MPCQCLPDEGLSTPSGSNTVRTGHTTTSPILLSACGESDTGIDRPSRCRSTPELDRLQAHPCAVMTDGTTADLLNRLLPAGVGKYLGGCEFCHWYRLKIGGTKLLGRDLPCEWADSRPSARSKARFCGAPSTLRQSLAIGRAASGENAGNLQRRLDMRRRKHPAAGGNLRLQPDS
jgi:hypothetical protein